jgi:D-lyxose ketol-isomerase
MKRSQINQAYRQALAFFERHSWALPPNAKWDITDFGLGDFARCGLTLVNLASEPEYCEKLMYARRGQTTPAHKHLRKKEDIICRVGELLVQVWAHDPSHLEPSNSVRGGQVWIDGDARTCVAGEKITLAAGSRITLVPGVWHAFYPLSQECVIGEVSTANDNVFADPRIGRFPELVEDELAEVRLVSEQS